MSAASAALLAIAATALSTLDQAVMTSTGRMSSVPRMHCSRVSPSLPEVVSRVDRLQAKAAPPAEAGRDGQPTPPQLDPAVRQERVDQLIHSHDPAVAHALFAVVDAEHVAVLVAAQDGPMVGGMIRPSCRAMGRMVQPWISSEASSSVSAASLKPRPAGAKTAMTVRGTFDQRQDGVPGAFSIGGVPCAQAVTRVLDAHEHRAVGPLDDGTAALGAGRDRQELLHLAPVGAGGRLRVRLRLRLGCLSGQASRRSSRSPLPFP